jgi:putative transposase
MRERAESGLTIKAYCETAGIHANTYYYWQRKLREAAGEELKAQQAAGTAPTPDALPTPSGWALATAGEATAASALTVEIGKIRVQVGADTDERLLAKVCRVLATLC